MPPSHVRKNGDLKDLSQNPTNQLKYVDLSDGLFFLGSDWLLTISKLRVWYVPKTPLRYFLRYGTIPLQFGKHYRGTCHSAHSFNILQITKLCRFKDKTRKFVLWKFSDIQNFWTWWSTILTVKIHTVTKKFHAGIENVQWKKQQTLFQKGIISH